MARRTMLGVCSSKFAIRKGENLVGAKVEVAALKLRKALVKVLDCSSFQKFEVGSDNSGSI